MTGAQSVKSSTRGAGRRRGVVLVAAVLCVGLLSGCLPRPPGDFFAAPAPLQPRFPGAIVWAD